MSTDLRDLYQEVILDHSKRPRNFHSLPSANRKAEGYNPLCGDRETVYLQVEGDVLKDVAFEGSPVHLPNIMLTKYTHGRNVRRTGL